MGIPARAAARQCSSGRFHQGRHPGSPSRPPLAASLYLGRETKKGAQRSHWASLTVNETPATQKAGTELREQEEPEEGPRERPRLDMRPEPTTVASAQPAVYLSVHWGRTAGKESRVCLPSTDRGGEQVQLRLPRPELSTRFRSDQAQRAGLQPQLPTDSFICPGSARLSTHAAHAPGGKQANRNIPAHSWLCCSRNTQGLKTLVVTWQGRKDTQHPRWGGPRTLVQLWLFLCQRS